MHLRNKFFAMTGRASKVLIVGPLVLFAAATVASCADASPQTIVVTGVPIPHCDSIGNRKLCYQTSTHGIMLRSSQGRERMIQFPDDVDESFSPLSYRGQKQPVFGFPNELAVVKARHGWLLASQQPELHRYFRFPPGHHAYWYVPTQEGGEHYVHSVEISASSLVVGIVMPLRTSYTKVSYRLDLTTGELVEVRRAMVDSPPTPRTGIY